MNSLSQLFKSLYGCIPEQTVPLGGSASHRKYYRLTGGGRSVIGVEGTDADENRAFITLAAHFASKGIRVPEVLGSYGLCYIQQDLGDTVLYDVAVAGGNFNVPLLEKTMSALPEIQVKAADGLPWEVCYPQESFDGRMVDFDLNYFKYDYLKLTGAEFNEVRLQDDFDRLKADLLSVPSGSFLYRDFNARNVMVHEGEPWFIDFQGGRRGPVHYDVASFLWQARAKFPQDLREHLLDVYIDSLERFMPVEREKFMFHMRLFILFRLLQVLGCYGFRGLWEGKEAFTSSIPLALDLLNAQLPYPEYPYLSEVLKCLR